VALPKVEYLREFACPFASEVELFEFCKVGFSDDMETFKLVALTSPYKLLSIDALEELAFSNKFTLSFEKLGFMLSFTL
jgi:hypothetical protein